MMRKARLISRRTVLAGSLGGLLLHSPALAMRTKLYPSLASRLKKQLSSVASADGISSPCSIVTHSGRMVDRVYVAAANPWFAQWGVWPEDDPGKQSIDIRDVAAIKDSPLRLPVQFARKLYEAGESGMGYTVFTVAFSDGSHQAYVTGNAVDFVEYPVGQSPSTVVDVLPHIGRADPNQRNGPDYFWCLFSDQPTS